MAARLTLDQLAKVRPLFPQPSLSSLMVKPQTFNLSECRFESYGGHVKKGINMAIKEFRDEYSFLSNFYPCEVEYNGIVFPTAEHAFQFQKVRPDNPIADSYREAILNARTASEAKRIGSTVPLVKKWDDNKVEIMCEIVKAKFDQHPELRFKLCATKHEKLIEGNYWNDEFWGISLHSNKGLNVLGQILMDLREQYS